MGGNESKGAKPKVDVRKQAKPKVDVPKQVVNRSPSFKNNTSFVIAIDFGTTYSGYAFALRNDPEKIYMNANWTNRMNISYKTPTCVLTGPNDEFVAFGYDALYNELLEEKPNDYHLYSNFKMIFQQNDKPTTDKKISSSSGHIIKAVKIFAYMIKGLKDHCLADFAKFWMKVPSLEMIQWILTVPAICSDSAKDFMRQAACDAGLIKSKDSDLLVIALEPEAVMYYGIKMMKEASERSFVKTEEFKLTLRKNDKYLVIHAGGGTTDITGYYVSDIEEICELIIPHCGPWGSFEVNKKFETFLCELLGENFVKEYKTKFPAEFWNLMFEFELEKKMYKDTKKMRISVSYCLSREYVKFYDTEIYEDIKIKKQTMKEYDDIDFIRGFIIVKNVFGRFFKDAIDNIVEHVKKLLSESSLEGINYVMLVGGFGQCQFLQEALNEIIPPKCSLIITPEAELAVLRGAVLFGINPDTVKFRIMTKTYGAVIMRWYDKSKHEKKLKVQFSGKDWCDGVFEPIILKGQSVKFGDKIIKRRTPGEENQTEMMIDIYCTDRTDFEDDDYVDKPYMQSVGHVQVMMNNMEKKFDRAIMVDFQFGGTEIKITAKDQSGKKT